MVPFVPSGQDALIDILCVDIGVILTVGISGSDEIKSPKHGSFFQTRLLPSYDTPFERS